MEAPVTRVALVTGGIGGIGTAICRRMAREGHRVVATYHPAEADQALAWQAAEREAGADVHIAPVDVSSFDSCRDLISKVSAELGPVDILVNGAGITRDKTLKKMDPEQWRAVLSTNLDSVFNVTKHVIDSMVDRGFGRVVNISSVNGQKGQFGQTNYSSAKAGMLGFTMSLAQEVATKGVTVNAISPGYIDTPMTAAMPDDIRNAIVAGIPLRRMGTPDDIANAVAFLISGDSDYITGVNLPVNGGMFMSC
ncbi:MAG: acetoacetyl-CoA reductase [Chromatiales bacterium]|nr:acetoacetyl-CoA reductase [Chromatiales bacterium]